MKIVLLQDVKALGKKGTIVEVAEGYARNFLLPKKLGAPATAENLNTLKLKKANEERIAAEQLAEAKALAEKIGESSVTVSIKGGENGKTYGSVLLGINGGRNTVDEAIDYLTRKENVSAREVRPHVQ